MLTKIIKIDKDLPEHRAIKYAIKVLKKGGLIAFPTETVYGLGANLEDKTAVEKLYEVKNRAIDKPFSVLIADIDNIDNFAVDVLPAAYRLADKFWPGPLTIILKSKNTATVGLRMPKCAFALQLVKRSSFPIVCPSANLSGNKEPLSAENVLKDFDGKIDLLIDAGKVELGVPSTVVDACSLPFKILRDGFIKQELIKEVFSKKRIMFICTGNSCRSVMAKTIFEKRLKEIGRSDIEVMSAGVTHSFIMGASPETQKLLKEEGIDVSGHRSQRIDPKMLKRCDLILVMERFQEQRILAMNPSLKGRLYLLKEFSQYNQDNLEIEDPIGKGIEVYKRTLSDIKGVIERLVTLV